MHIRGEIKEYNTALIGVILKGNTGEGKLFLA